MRKRASFIVWGPLEKANIKKSYANSAFWKTNKFTGKISMGLIFHCPHKVNVKHFINLVKSALNGWAFDNDNQIKVLDAQRVKCEQDEERTEIIIMETHCWPC